MRTISLADPIPVYLVYLTAWVAPDGGLNFRNDIYGRDARLDSALREAELQPSAAPAPGTVSTSPSPSTSQHGTQAGRSAVPTSG
jgi:hypothetical protein